MDAGILIFQEKHTAQRTVSRRRFEAIDPAWRNSLLLLMTRPVHGAVRTVAAAGRLAFLFIPAQLDDDTGHDGSRYRHDQDIG